MEILVKKKDVRDIKYADRVLPVLRTTGLFGDILNLVSLDRLALQKTLADLSKHGYISKDSRGLWVLLGD
jgi:phosphoribosyl-AMP cyclohydrolase